jgi:hypothetical protein
LRRIRCQSKLNEKIDGSKPDFVRYSFVEALSLAYDLLKFARGSFDTRRVDPYRSSDADPFI